MRLFLKTCQILLTNYWNSIDIEIEDGRLKIIGEWVNLFRKQFLNQKERKKSNKA